VTGPTPSRLRCRLGFHKWTRYKGGDTVAGPPKGPAGFGDAVRAAEFGPGFAGSRVGGHDGWETRCRCFWQ